MADLLAAHKLLAGDRRALAKGITLVESSHPRHRQQAEALLEAILPEAGKSIRIGISGTPGVGKSTFIEALGLQLIEQGHRLAVLAVDPSSPVAGGSILGDKTRMEELSRCPQAFIRPSPSGGELGGVAQKTRESLLLCEAAGFDLIFVETVGVGQSEYQVANMVDFFLVLMQPNGGDELQGIKKGILELADALVVNKADGPLKHFAQQAKRNYQQAFDLVMPNSFWRPQVLTCSALSREGIAEVWQCISSFQQQAQAEDHIQHKRNQQNKAWMESLFQQLLLDRLQQQESFVTLKKDLESQVLKKTITPLSAAHKLLKEL